MGRVSLHEARISAHNERTWTRERLRHYLSGGGEISRPLAMIVFGWTEKQAADAQEVAERYIEAEGFNSTRFPSSKERKGGVKRRNVENHLQTKYTGLFSFT